MKVNDNSGWHWMMMETLFLLAGFSYYWLKNCLKKNKKIEIMKVDQDGETISSIFTDIYILIEKKKGRKWIRPSVLIPLN